MNRPQRFERHDPWPHAHWSDPEPEMSFGERMVVAIVAGFCFGVILFS